MRIDEQQHGAIVVLKPNGPLAGDEVEVFRDRLEQVQRETVGRFVVDISSIPLVDSEGLDALVDAAETMAANGRALKLCGVNQILREVFELTDLMTRFDCYEDVNTASRSFI